MEANTGAVEEQPLQIPVGVSDRLCIPMLRRYDTLYEGEYRMVKVLQTAAGEVTVTAGFSVAAF